jgi:hypothetical protein
LGSIAEDETIDAWAVGDTNDNADDQLEHDSEGENDEESRLLGAGGGGYDMLALLMDAELALASLEGPSLPAHSRPDQQLTQFFAARRAVRSEVAARARLATLGLHHPQTASALLQLGLQLEEDLGELEPASRAIRRAFVGFRAALGRQDPQTIEALVSLRRVENRLLSGLEHVHDDDLAMVIEAAETLPEMMGTDDNADGQAGPGLSMASSELASGSNHAEPTQLAEGAAADISNLSAPLKFTDTLGYGAGAVSTGVRRKMLRIAVRSKTERALRNVVSVDMQGLPTQQG